MRDLWHRWDFDTDSRTALSQWTGGRMLTCSMDTKLQPWLPCWPLTLPSFLDLISTTQKKPFRLSHEKSAGVFWKALNSQPALFNFGSTRPMKLHGTVSKRNCAWIWGSLKCLLRSQIRILTTNNLAKRRTHPHIPFYITLFKKSILFSLSWHVRQFSLSPSFVWQPTVTWRHHPNMDNTTWWPSTFFLHGDAIVVHLDCPNFQKMHIWPLVRYFWIRWPFKKQWNEVARRGSQRELMDNQLIVSLQSEHGRGSERQESTQTQTWV